MKQVAALLLAGLAACASRPPDCDPNTAWQRAVAGRAAEPGCAATGDPLWLEARNLGDSYRRLRLEQAAWHDRAEGAALARVRLERELNEILGAARVRGWTLPDSSP